MSHKKFGPDRFSRFDVYWIQTDKQTDKPNLYIDRRSYDLTQMYNQPVMYIIKLINKNKLSINNGFDICFDKAVLNHKCKEKFLRHNKSLP